MSLTYEEAVNSILSVFKTSWDSTGYNVHYENTREERGSTSDPFAEIELRHFDSKQTTMGGTGNRHFERKGMALIKISTPSGKGLSESYILAKVVSDAYEGITSSEGVIFRNVRLNELGHNGPFLEMLVLVDFEYFELK
jgi:hypothetical protein